jgi:hypothetical protein
MSTSDLAIFAVSGDAEKDLDHFINNVLVLFTSSFGTAIPAFFNSFVASEIQLLANRFFAQELALNETCPAAPPGKPTFNEATAIYAGSGAVGLCAVVAFALFIKRRQYKG